MIPGLQPEQGNVAFTNLGFALGITFSCLPMELLETNFGINRHSNRDNNRNAPSANDGPMHISSEQVNNNTNIYAQKKQ